MCEENNTLKLEKTERERRGVVGRGYALSRSMRAKKGGDEIYSTPF